MEDKDKGEMAHIQNYCWNGIVCREGVLHGVDCESFTLHSVYPSGKWLSSSGIHLHMSTICTVCTHATPCI